MVKIIPFLKAFEGCGEAFLEKFPTRVSPRISPLNCNLKFQLIVTHNTVSLTAHGKKSESVKKLHYFEQNVQDIILDKYNRLLYN